MPFCAAAQHDAHRGALPGDVGQHGLAPRSRVHLRAAVPMDLLEPQQRLHLLCGPQEPEVRAAHGVVRVGRVRNEHDLVPGIGQQWQQAVTLVIEAVRGPSDLRGPEEAQLVVLILVHAQWPNLSRGRLRPQLDLPISQALKLSPANGIGIAPLLEGAVEHVRGDRGNDLGDLVCRQKAPVDTGSWLEQVRHPFVERPQWHEQLGLQCRQDALQGAVAV
mmetsp:Transcript_42430/g.118128  ORF Transcript_42430/g.118128 Transcript_42430/m.118128 type:complete len:219 (-) Transcript_42430:459-1115(-)